MRRLHISTTYSQHSCFECVGYNSRDMTCRNNRSIFFGSVFPHDACACSDIQYSCYRDAKKPKRTKITSVYDYEFQ